MNILYEHFVYFTETEHFFCVCERDQWQQNVKSSAPLHAAWPLATRFPVSSLDHVQDCKPKPSKHNQPFCYTPEV